VGRADEDRGLAVADHFIVELGGPGDDEQLVVIDVDLGQLVRAERVLDRQRVQPVGLLEGAQLGLGRIDEPDPHEFGVIARALGPLLDGDLAHSPAVAVKVRGDNGHGPPDRSSAPSITEKCDRSAASRGIPRLSPR